MRRVLLAVLAVAGLSACSGKLPEGVDEAILTQAVGKSIGSPSTRRARAAAASWSCACRR